MALTAVVDLGSNSFRLVVFRHDPDGGWGTWDEIRAPVRLGAGMGPEGRLQPERVERALEAVSMFVAFCRSAGVGEVLATGTSALRRAVNGAEVVAAIEERGLPVRMLSGEEEARFGGLAILHTSTVREGFGLDMGGGSAQLMRLGPGVEVAVSLPLGAVRTTEEFLSGTGTGGIAALREAVRGHLAELPWFRAEGRPIAGIGGSVRNLAAAARHLAGGTDGTVQGFVLTREGLADVVEELAGRDARDRGRLPGISPDRGDVILAAAVVLERVLEAGGFPAVEVTEAGLREGLFLDRLRDGTVPPDVGRASAENLLRRHGADSAHAARVAGHALVIHDALAAAGLVTGDGRRLLEPAAMLHDVGRAVGFGNRHRHARSLILEEGLPGLLLGDAAVVAETVRYAVKGRPEPGSPVEVSSGIVRLASALERTRAKEVCELEVNVGDAVEVRAGVRADAVGPWVAQDAAGLLARALGREVRVRSRVVHRGSTAR